MPFVFKKIGDKDSEFNSDSIEFTIGNDEIDLDNMIIYFENFLVACGYKVDENIGVIKEEL